MTEAEKRQLADLLRGLVSDRVEVGYSPPPPRSDFYAPEIDIFIEDLLPTVFKSSLEALVGRPVMSVAIECQGTGSRKHRLGDIVNASLHGDVGIVICDDYGHRETCARIARYLDHHKVLRARGLPLILTLAEFIKLCKDTE